MMSSNSADFRPVTIFPNSGPLFPTTAAAVQEYQVQQYHSQYHHYNNYSPVQSQKKSRSRQRNMQPFDRPAAKKARVSDDDPSWSPRCSMARLFKEFDFVKAESTQRRSVRPRKRKIVPDAAPLVEDDSAWVLQYGHLLGTTQLVRVKRLSINDINRIMKSQNLKPSQYVLDFLEDHDKKSKKNRGTCPKIGVKIHHNKATPIFQPPAEENSDSNDEDDTQVVATPKPVLRPRRSTEYQYQQHLEPFDFLSCPSPKKNKGIQVNADLDFKNLEKPHFAVQTLSKKKINRAKVDLKGKYRQPMHRRNGHRGKDKNDGQSEDEEDIPVDPRLASRCSTYKLDDDPKVQPLMKKVPDNGLQDDERRSRKSSKPSKLGQTTIEKLSTALIVGQEQRVKYFSQLTQANQAQLSSKSNKNSQDSGSQQQIHDKKPKPAGRARSQSAAPFSTIFPPPKNVNYDLAYYYNTLGATDPGSDDIRTKYNFTSTYNITAAAAAQYSSMYPWVGNRAVALDYKIPKKGQLLESNRAPGESEPIFFRDDSTPHAPIPHDDNSTNWDTARSSQNSSTNNGQIVVDVEGVENVIDLAIPPEPASATTANKEKEPTVGVSTATKEVLQESNAIDEHQQQVQKEKHSNKTKKGDPEELEEGEIRDDDEDDFSFRRPIQLFNPLFHLPGFSDNGEDRMDF